MNDNYEFMSITAKNKSGGKCQLIKEPLSNASQNKYVVPDRIIHVFA
jgi:hypothetical protein